MRPYPDQLGESNKQMRKAKKIKPKVKSSDGWTPTMDNGKVMTGEAFKHFLK